MNVDQTVKTPVASRLGSTDHHHPIQKGAVNIKQIHQLGLEIPMENLLQVILEVEVLGGKIIMTLGGLTTKIENLIGIIGLEIITIEFAMNTTTIVVELSIFTINTMIDSEIEIVDIEEIIRTIDLGKYDSYNMGVGILLLD